MNKAMPDQETCYDGWKTALQAHKKLESAYRRAIALLTDAAGCIEDELGSMDEEEQSQPIPARHARILGNINKFLSR